MADALPSPPDEAPLSLRTVFVGLVVLVLGAVLLSLTWVNAQGVSEEEIARRCAESSPHWDNYQEDIKGMIGAKPAAEWHGEPRSAQVEDRTLRVEFALTGSWATRPSAIPLLIKDPAGTIAVARGATKDGRSVYEAPVSPSAPWVEVQYPHHRVRLNFDASGRWSAAH
jgi:hypothetical protein